MDFLRISCPNFISDFKDAKFDILKMHKLTLMMHSLCMIKTQMRSQMRVGVITGDARYLCGSYIETHFTR